MGRGSENLQNPGPRNRCLLIREFSQKLAGGIGKGAFHHT
nr:MAG TPA: hypothetical protein [Caudoviricetes sp.]